MNYKEKWKPVLQMKGKVPEELVKEFKEDVEKVKSKSKRYGI